MDNTEFIIQLIDKTIWPLTILLLLFLIRRQLRLLTPFIKKIKFSDFELEIDRELAKVNAEAQDEFIDASEDWKVNLVRIAQNSASAAILEAWKEVESKSEKLIVRFDSSIDLNISTRFKLMQKIMIKEGLIESKKAKIFDDLRQIRNKVAHAKDYEVTKEQALNYISIAIQLVEYLERKMISS